MSSKKTNSDYQLTHYKFKVKMEKIIKLTSVKISSFFDFSLTIIRPVKLAKKYTIKGNKSKEFALLGSDAKSDGFQYFILWSYSNFIRT